MEKEKAFSLQRELERAAREKERRELEERRKALEEKRRLVRNRSYNCLTVSMFCLHEKTASIEKTMSSPLIF